MKVSYFIPDLGKDLRGGLSARLVGWIYTQAALLVCFSSVDLAMYNRIVFLFYFVCFF